MWIYRLLPDLSLKGGFIGAIHHPPIEVGVFLLFYNKTKEKE